VSPPLLGSLANRTHSTSAVRLLLCPLLDTVYRCATVKKSRQTISHAGLIAPFVRIRLVEEAFRPLRILLVEDNPAEVTLMREALRFQPEITLEVVEDGEAAVAHVRGEAPYTAAKRPQLVLLDLNLPGRSGFEVLATLKADPALCSIPVLVLTNSSAPQDITRCYQLHANGYVHKPFEFDDFFQRLLIILHFWGSVVQLPD
jgi:CheY-like chemotaxis protein